MKLLSLLILNLFVMADALSEEKSSPYKVIILDSSIEASKLKPHKIEKKFKANDFPSIERRNSDFKKASLEQEVSAMDELDRDVLWFDAKNLTIDNIHKKYSKIPKEKIEVLMKETRK